MHFTQNWLRNHNGNFDLLKEQLGIKPTFHEDGRVLLNYHQIDSPKTHPMVMQCRQLTLDSNNNYELVAFARTLL